MLRFEMRGRERWEYQQEQDRVTTKVTFQSGGIKELSVKPNKRDVKDVKKRWETSNGKC